MAACTLLLRDLRESARRLSRADYEDSPAEPGDLDGILVIGMTSRVFRLQVHQRKR